MKKFFKFALMAIAMLVASTSMVSCGDDEIKPSTGDDTPDCIIYGSSISASSDAAKAAANEIINYICSQIGTGTNFKDGFIYVPYKLKDNATTTFNKLNEDQTWADNICKKGDNVRVIIDITLNKNTVFAYSYPHTDAVGTSNGTEGESVWKIVLTNDDKANAHREGSKKGTVTVPEGMEIAAGEYAGEWHVNSINGYPYFFSDKFYGDSYSEENAYIRLFISSTSDGTYSSLIYLRYQEGSEVKQKSHKVTLTKE